MQRKERDEVLIGLANAVAARPMDQVALRQAADEVEAKLGREALVEAAGVAGAFETFTKVADSTGKEEIPPTMLNSIGLHAGCLRMMTTR